MIALNICVIVRLVKRKDVSGVPLFLLVKVTVVLCNVRTAMMNIQIRIRVRSLIIIWIDVRLVGPFSVPIADTPS